MGRFPQDGTLPWHLSLFWKLWQCKICMKFSAVRCSPVKRWVVAWVFYWIGKRKYPRNNWEKKVLANQARPQQTSKLFKKVANVRVNYHHEETDPYEQYIKLKKNTKFELTNFTSERLKLTNPFLICFLVHSFMGCIWLDTGSILIGTRSRKRVTNF